MATLTSSETFSVGAAATIEETVQIPVVSAPVPPSGTGRLVHPTLGTYDYEMAPPEWGNMDVDAVVPPIWQNSKTLTGGSNTLWIGVVQDVEVYERWTGPVAMYAPQMRMFLDMWTNPPIPPEYVVWYPNYLNEFAFKVIILDVSTGGSKGVNMDYTLFQGNGFVKGPVTLSMRLVDYYTE
jgi:hypothetical protein